MLTEASYEEAIGILIKCFGNRQQIISRHMDILNNGDQITILLRFRLHPIARTADISKMYWAVHLDPSDRDLHRFLWREHLTEPIRDYRMTRVTFGVLSSPFLAVQTLQQVAKDFCHLYPTAGPLVTEAFYVDDLLTRAETPEQALTIFHQLRSLLEMGGFDLRKWRCSSPSILESIEPSLREKIPIQVCSSFLLSQTVARATKNIASDIASLTFS